MRKFVWFALLLLPFQVRAAECPATQSIKVRWKVPITRTDKTPLALSDIKFFSVYVETVGGADGWRREGLVPARTVAPVESADGINATVVDVGTAADRFLVVTATDTYDQESVISNEKTVPACVPTPAPAPPAPPSLLDYQILQTQAELSQAEQLASALRAHLEHLISLRDGS